MYRNRTAEEIFSTEKMMSRATTKIFDEKVLVSGDKRSGPTLILNILYEFI